MENFIDDIIKKFRKEAKFRFPPENNAPGLHLGHAKSLCLNFGLAEKYNTSCNLRFDDTNPETEKQEYADKIIEDIEWLGFKPSNIFYTSDYFYEIYDYAIKLIKMELAYVCDLTAEEISEYRGVPTRPGKESPYRNRSVDENLDIFLDMKNGESNSVLRAKIDMSSPNMHMRDPIIYRVKNKKHYRTDDDWCIYPTYDFAHPLSDAIEGITHSLCTLEFEVHKPFYEWVIDNLIIGRKPIQIEFARLNIEHGLMSKRKINSLIDNGVVMGWDNPNLFTLAGLRRRGFTPNSIKMFCEKIGISKRENIIDYKLLESCLREDCNINSNRVMAVLDPIKVTITNYPIGQVEFLEAKNNPEGNDEDIRPIAFSRNLWIEREDFKEEANSKFFRLTVGKEVRFKFAYYITCNEVIKDDEGNIIELLCTYDPETKGGWSNDGRKVKGTIHWVCADNCDKLLVREYGHLFNDREVTEDSLLNEEQIIDKRGFIEKNVKDTNTVQFERKGYYILDKDSTDDLKIYNMTTSLRDSYKE